MCLMRLAIGVGASLMLALKVSAQSSCKAVTGTAVLDINGAPVTAFVSLDGCDARPAAMSYLTTSAVAIPTSSISTAEKPQATHMVEVGARDQLLFDPIEVFAAAGDVVQFNFHRFNHSVVESSLEAPCNATLGGFNSGFGHTDLIDGDFVALEVRDQEPRWFFCNQVLVENHCQRHMVFGLNPGTSMNDFLGNVDHPQSNPSTMSTMTPTSYGMSSSSSTSSSITTTTSSTTVTSSTTTTSSTTVTSSTGSTTVTGSTTTSLATSLAPSPAAVTSSSSSTSSPEMVTLTIATSAISVSLATRTSGSATIVEVTTQFVPTTLLLLGTSDAMTVTTSSMTTASPQAINAAPARSVSEVKPFMTTTPQNPGSTSASQTTTLGPSLSASSTIEALQIQTFSGEAGTSRILWAQMLLSVVMSLILSL